VFEALQAPTQGTALHPQLIALICFQTIVHNKFFHNQATVLELALAKV